MDPKEYITVELTEDELRALLVELSDVEMDYTDLGIAKLKLYQAMRSLS